MKKIRTLVIASFIVTFANTILAQKPEKIYSMAKVAKPNEYYRRQVDLWKGELEKNKQDANAWLNYYKANRYATFDNEEAGPKLEMRTKRLQSIVDEMGKHVPNSFEFNYVRYTNGGNDLGLFPFLEKAYELNPENVDVHIDMATYYEIIRDLEKKDFFMQKWITSGEMSPGFLNYNYNVLAGLEKDAILLSNGDNDTYPAWILQLDKNFRKDVKVLNVHLLLIKEYRDRVFRELGIPPLKLDPMANNDDYVKFQETLINHISQNDQNRPVYICLTTSESYTKSLNDKLYLTGLALKYSEKKFDNLAVLKKNFEQHYALDYLKIYFPKDISEGMVRLMNYNYLVPLITLHEHYKVSGEAQKADKVKELALKTSKGGSQEEQVKEYFGKK